MELEKEGVVWEGDQEGGRVVRGWVAGGVLGCIFSGWRVGGRWYGMERLVEWGGRGKWLFGTMGICW